jgi:hypothetical protein
LHFGQRLSGGSVIRWNASKPWPHLAQRYSYVGM